MIKINDRVECINKMNHLFGEKGTVVASMGDGTKKVAFENGKLDFLFSSMLKKVTDKAYIVYDLFADGSIDVLYICLNEEKAKELAKKENLEYDQMDITN